MHLQLTGLGKRYGREWIFRHLDLDLPFGEKLAITGYNGSGKSTLLSLIGGFVLPTEGKVSYGIAHEHPMCHIGFVAPYQNLIEEFTLREHLNFHAQFKAPLATLPNELAHCGLLRAEHKLVGEFSSGMKQRLRLLLALCFANDMVLLDEPTSNLDAAGAEWYQHLLQSCQGTLLIASNQPAEYQMCPQLLSIENFKPQTISR